MDVPAKLREITKLQKYNITQHYGEAAMMKYGRSLHAEKPGMCLRQQ